jgi:hypothetical protein
MRKQPVALRSARSAGPSGRPRRGTAGSPATRAGSSYEPSGIAEVHVIENRPSRSPLAAFWAPCTASRLNFKERFLLVMKDSPCLPRSGSQTPKDGRGHGAPESRYPSGGPSTAVAEGSAGRAVVRTRSPVAGVFGRGASITPQRRPHASPRHGSVIQVQQRQLVQAKLLLVQGRFLPG